MLIHPEFDPVAIRLGPLAIHWYGLSYLTAFILFVLLGRMRLRQKPYARQVEQGLWRTTDVEDLLLAGILGVILGGRLGYVLFYKPQWYLSHPLDIFKVWEGGMSFHGGLLGVLGMFTWFAWRRQRPWLEVSDFVAPCVPTGLATGRLGNFINGARSRCLPTLGHGLSAKRQHVAAPPVATVSSAARRLAALHHLVALRPQSAQPRQGVCRLLDGLWRLALHRRILPRTR